MTEAIDAPFLLRPIRQSTQLRKVHSFLRSGEWLGLDEIAEAVGAPIQSVSARVRDLRKPQFGGYRIERRRIDRTTYVYRMILSN